MAHYAPPVKKSLLRNLLLFLHIGNDFKLNSEAEGCIHFGSGNKAGVAKWQTHGTQNPAPARA